MSRQYEFNRQAKITKPEDVEPEIELIPATYGTAVCRTCAHTMTVPVTPGKHEFGCVCGALYRVDNYPPAIALNERGSAT